MKFMFDSAYEYFRMKQLDKDENIILWIKNSSPLTKWADDKGKLHNYSPDFIIWFKDGGLKIEEIKGFQNKDAKSKREAIEKFCEENNIEFQFLMFEDVFCGNEYSENSYRQFIKNYDGIKEYF